MLSLHCLTISTQERVQNTSSTSACLPFPTRGQGSTKTFFILYIFYSLLSDLTQIFEFTSIKFFFKPHSSALPPPTYYYTVPHPRLARCMGVFFLLALLLLHTQCSEEALCIITRRRMPRIASKRRNTPRAVL